MTSITMDASSLKRRNSLAGRLQGAFDICHKNLRSHRFQDYFHSSYGNFRSVRFWRRYFTNIKEDFVSTWESLRKVKWKPVMISSFLHVVVLGSAVTIMTLFLTNIYNNEQYLAPGACRPDGSFDTGVDRYNEWAISGLFQITLGFGALSFTKVKAISIIWDMTIGRGGQAIMALVSYKIVTKALSRSMENASVTYGTFVAITLQESSLSSLFKISRDYRSNKGARAKFEIVWVTLSLAFILAFPTLISAMSGYSSNSQAFVRVNNSTLVPWADFRLVRYVINDGHRIGLNASSQVLTSIPEQEGVDPLSWNADICTTDFSILNSSYYDYRPDSASVIYSEVQPQCRLLWHVSDYIQQYSLTGIKYINTTFDEDGKMISLPSPSLNISRYYAADSSNNPNADWASTVYALTGLSGWSTTTGEFDTAPNIPIAFSLAGTGTLYDVPYLQQWGSCQQLSTYKWGFSFLLAFIVLTITGVWMIGTYILWLDVYLNSRLDRASRDLGAIRASMDLSFSVAQSLDGTPALRKVPNRDLKERIKYELKGGKISYQSLAQEIDYLPQARGAEIASWSRRGGWRRLWPRVILYNSIWLFILFLFIPGALCLLPLLSFLFALSWIGCGKSITREDPVAGKLAVTLDA